MRSTVVFRALALVLVGVSSGIRAQSGLLELGEGFEQSVLRNLDASAPFELQIGGICYSPSGEPIIYENGSIRILGSEGDEVLTSFDPAPSGSFLRLAPDGERVVFGENTVGDVISVPLSGGEPELMGTIPFNHAIDFAPPSAPEEIRGLAFVSALGDLDNSIFLLDPSLPDPVDEIVAEIPSFSGPLAFDDDANLYYVTARFDTSPQLVRYTPEQLVSGLGEGALDLSVAEEILSDLTGGFHMLFHEEKLYLTNLGFGVGAGRVETIAIEQNFLVSAFARIPSADGVISPTFLAVRPGVTPFESGAGKDGGTVMVYYSDFFSVSQLVEVTPELFFIRGEVNRDGTPDISDVVTILGALFRGGFAPHPVEAADVNDDSKVDISDPVYLLNFLFLIGAPPPAPYPDRGPDPTP